MLNPPLMSILIEKGAKYFKSDFCRFEADGVIPWKRVIALVKLAAVSYPYLSAMSIKIPSLIQAHYNRKSRVQHAPNRVHKL